MAEDLGQALVEFDAALRCLRGTLQSDTLLYEAVFADSDDWLNLLTYKLLPHMAGEGCLIVAVAGGTNSGKSTVFNLLLGANVSPVVATAAATRHPLIAANRKRCAQCLGGLLVPEFKSFPVDGAQGVLSKDFPAEALFVAQADTLPDRLAVLDTPDVDSIEKQNWKVAESIRAAGDVLIAVLSGEKYKDERVVEFFRGALASGRVVLPLMNKANPEDDYAVARKQLDEFCAELDPKAPCFVIPHDFTLARNFARPIAALDGSATLLDYLQTLDVPAIKRRVYRGSVARFAERAGQFIVHAEDVGAGLRAVVKEFEARARRFAEDYDPAPGAEISGLFHQFVQSKRGKFERLIANASTAILKGATAIARKTTGALLRRATLQKGDVPVTDAEIRATHAQAVERITRDLATSYVESARTNSEPAAHLLEAAMNRLDVEPAVAAVLCETLRSESISEDFRRHANAMLDEWWNDHTVKRRILIALDGLLFITPTAIAIPISFHTGGFGATEAMIFAGTVGEQFLARVIEYQFGDAMFNFLAPWRAEQQRNLEEALLKHLATPCLQALRTYLDALEGDAMSELRRSLETCRKA